MTALGQHHNAEQDLLWRRLRDRDALAEPVQQRLGDGHREHFALLSELDGLLPLWEGFAAQDVVGRDQYAREMSAVRGRVVVPAQL